MAEHSAPCAKVPVQTAVEICEKCSPASLGIYVVIKSLNCGGDSDGHLPCQSKIAERAHVKPSTVRRHLRWLSREDFIHHVERMKLTERQLDVLEFIEGYIDEHHCAPTIEEIREGWQKLEKQCEKFTSEGFAAIPGLTYQDAQGNHLFAFSDRVSPPKTEWLTEDGKRLATTKKYRTRNYFNYINEHLQQKVISGFWRHDDNFLHQADYKLYNGFPVKSFVDGKPVDDAVEEYQYWMVNGGAQAALAFEIMTTPDMVARRARKGWQVISNRKPVTLRKRWHRGALSFSGDGDQYITNGPKILTWRRSSNMGMHGQWYRPDLAQYEISLKVASDAGLRTVTLYNGRPSGTRAPNHPITPFRMTKASGR